MKEKNYLSQVRERLRKEWFRVTPQREAVAGWIAGRKGMFTAEQMVKSIKGVDRASVYRILSLFTKLNLVHPTLILKGKEYYEVQGRRHHHHEICTGCEKTICIPCPLPRKKSKMLKVQHHTFAITGLCKSCVK